jgi:hypothetical protein
MEIEVVIKTKEQNDNSQKLIDFILNLTETKNNEKITSEYKDLLIKNNY